MRSPFPKNGTFVFYLSFEDFLTLTITNKLGWYPSGGRFMRLDVFFTLFLWTELNHVVSSCESKYCFCFGCPFTISKKGHWKETCTNWLFISLLSGFTPAKWAQEDKPVGGGLHRQQHDKIEKSHQITERKCKITVLLCFWQNPVQKASRRC